MGALVVGTRDQLRIQTVVKMSKGLMKAKDAMALLDVSERTLRRWLRSYENKGLAFINHGNKGKIPKNKKPKELLQQIMNFVEAELYDFNMLHALEKIESRFNLKLNRETFRKLCHQKGLVKQAHKRRGKPRFHRNRYSQKGFMLQLDGSHHRWFNVHRR